MLPKKQKYASKKDEMREMYWPSQLIFQRHTRLFAFKMNQKSSKNCKFLSKKKFANIDVIDNISKLASHIDWKKSSNCTLFNFNNAACKKKVFAPFFPTAFYCWCSIVFDNFPLKFYFLSFSSTVTILRNCHSLFLSNMTFKKLN